MRDAIEMFEWAEHGRAWSDWLHGVGVRLLEWLAWAGKAFEVSGQHRAG